MTPSNLAKPLTADEIAWVGQENPNGCVIASLAMVTGIPYREILSTYPWAVDGCDMEIVAADFLYRKGIAWQRIYCNQPAPRFENHHRADWPPEPWAPAHLCMVETSQNHCVVMKNDGTVLDPLSPQPKRLTDYKKTMQVWGLFNIATIEQQAEQIVKLRSALVIAHRVADDWVNDQLRGTSLLKSALSELQPCREALASTEPVNDKR